MIYEGKEKGQIHKRLTEIPNQKTDPYAWHNAATFQ